MTVKNRKQVGFRDLNQTGGFFLHKSCHQRYSENVTVLNIHFYGSHLHFEYMGLHLFNYFN